MSAVSLRNSSTARQCALAMLLVVGVSAACYLPGHVLPYRVVAFVLLVTVSLVAMFFDRLPVLIAAALSALIWDFFFIPPYFTLQVALQEDAILLAMYFIIAMVNAALTYQIRRMEREAKRKEDKARLLHLYSTLFNSLSHELRTPIAAIIGATDNLQSDNARLSPQHKSELIREIAKAAFRLNRQVANLLHMSRIEAGALQLHTDWCDVSETIYEVVRRAEESRPQQQIRISIPNGLPLFLLDEALLAEILGNLLQNALRYTPPGSLIELSAEAGDGLLKLAVADDGPGFPPASLDRVFDKFYRLPQTQAGGTGLGLSIVKGFTEAMGGTVSLSNRQPHGALFSLSIPAATAYPQNLDHDE